jgi:putative PIN family toxin of toxin-antitoxin system
VRAVLDTNIYVSLLLAPRGASAWLMALWRNKEYEVVISPDLFAELVEVLNRPEIARQVDSQRKLAIFHRLRYEALWVSEALNAAGALPDPGDDFLVSAAVEAEAACIVTWDKLLLAQKVSRGIVLLNPDQFIAQLVRSKRD